MLRTYHSHSFAVVPSCHLYNNWRGAWMPVVVGGAESGVHGVLVIRQFLVEWSARLGGLGTQG